jgi:hypothetical protein
MSTEENKERSDLPGAGFAASSERACGTHSALPYSTSSEDSASSTGLGRRWTLPEFRRNFSRKFYQARLRRSTHSVHHLYTNPAKFPVVPGCCWCAYSAYLKDFETTINTPKPAGSFSK